MLIIHSTDPDLPKGTDVVFAAADDTPDIITLVFPISPDVSCENAPFPLTFFPLQGDAIQIQP